MSSFKRGDKVRMKDGSNFSNGMDVVTVKSFDRDNFLVRLKETGTTLQPKYIEKVEEDMEKKYKLETELSLEEIVQLRAFVGTLSSMGVLYEEIEIILDGAGLMGEDLLLKDYIKEGHLRHVKLSYDAERVVAKSKRKVVTVGNKKYYEDELQTALSNIKPI